MDYVVKDDGTILSRDGNLYTGYVRDCDWYEAIARGRRPCPPLHHMDFRPKPVLCPKRQG